MAETVYSYKFLWCVGHFKIGVKRFRGWQLSVNDLFTDLLIAKSENSVTGTYYEYTAPLSFSNLYKLNLPL